MPSLSEIVVTPIPVLRSDLTSSTISAESDGRPVFIGPASAISTTRRWRSRRRGVRNTLRAGTRRPGEQRGGSSRASADGDAQRLLEGSRRVAPGEAIDRDADDAPLNLPDVHCKLDLDAMRVGDVDAEAVGPWLKLNRADAIPDDLSEIRVWLPKGQDGFPVPDRVHDLRAHPGELRAARR